MEPFFTYFGGKYRSAARYDRPQYPLIVEPFAGSAGYATRYGEGKSVLLIEKNPVVAGVWQFLLSANINDILDLPDLYEGQSVDDFDMPEGARSLIGFWLNKGSASPCKTPSAWMRAGTHNNSFWGSCIRTRIASNLHFIKHWQIVCGEYSDAPDEEATWFIDPPYIKAGKDYVFSSLKIDYAHLARFCQSRRGQVTVCENEGATWLPFQAFTDLKGAAGKGRTGVSAEAIWTNKGFSLFD